MDDKKIARRYNVHKLEWLRFVKLFLVLVVVFFLLFRFVIGFSIVSGDSMLNTLSDGEIVFYTRINPSVEAGDIVSVAYPSGKYFVKRVVAVAGDVVDIKDGTLYVNGVPEEGDYFLGATKPELGSFTYPYTVGEDCVFVLGDNREVSEDSRRYGAFNLRQIGGVLHLRMGWLYAHLVK